MTFDESHEQYEEMQLFYDVMEIGLAVMGPASNSDFFRFIDNALDTFNIGEMRLIKDAFDGITAEQRIALIDGERDSAEAIAALRSLVANCRTLGNQRHIKIA